MGDKGHRLQEKERWGEKKPRSEKERRTALQMELACVQAAHSLQILMEVKCVEFTGVFY